MITLFTSLLQHYAARGGHQEVCECLISSGANVNSQTPGGVTALHRAAYCGHLSVVQTLLRYKADAGLKDSDGHTPLHKASSEQCLYYKITLLFNYRQQQEVITV